MHRFARPGSRVGSYSWQLVAVLALAFAIVSVAPADARKKKKQNPPGTLDGGQLVLSWFGSEDLEFREADEIDYLWVKDGFSAEGKTLHFESWPDPEFIGPDADERDANDRRLARQMNGEMARTFQEEWGRLISGLETSLENGDVRVEGRIVDCSTGSTAAKVLVGWGAGAGYTTLDLKLTDKATGELLAALHHRVVSGTSWSTTDSKLVKWVGKLAKAIDEAGGLAELYADGDRREK